MSDNRWTSAFEGRPGPSDIRQAQDWADNEPAPLPSEPTSDNRRTSALGVTAHWSKDSPERKRREEQQKRENRWTSAFEVLLACGHILKVDGGPSDAGPGRYFCPYGCGPQTAVEAPSDNRRSGASDG